MGVYDGVLLCSYGWEIIQTACYLAINPSSDHVLISAS
jgi:hypothetical protein